MHFDYNLIYVTIILSCKVRVVSESGRSAFFSVSSSVALASWHASERPSRRVTSAIVSQVLPLILYGPRVLTLSPHLPSSSFVSHFFYSYIPCYLYASFHEIVVIYSFFLLISYQFLEFP